MAGQCRRGGPTSKPAGYARFAAKARSRTDCGPPPDGSPCRTFAKARHVRENRTGRRRLLFVAHDVDRRRRRLSRLGHVQNDRAVGPLHEVPGMAQGTARAAASGQIFVARRAAGQRTADAEQAAAGWREPADGLPGIGGKVIGQAESRERLAGQRRLAQFRGFAVSAATRTIRSLPGRSCGMRSARGIRLL